MSCCPPPGDIETSVPLPYFNANLFAKLKRHNLHLQGSKIGISKIQPQINSQRRCQTFYKKFGRLIKHYKTLTVAFHI